MFIDINVYIFVIEENSKWAATGANIFCASSRPFFIFFDNSKVSIVNDI